MRHTANRTIVAHRLRQIREVQYTRQERQLDVGHPRRLCRNETPVPGFQYLFNQASDTNARSGAEGDQMAEAAE
jgi:hypothetical protein